MKLGTKLGCGFAIPVILLILVAGFTCWKLSLVREAARQTAEGKSAVYARLAETMNANVINVQQALTDASLTGDKDELENARKSADIFTNGLGRFRKLFEAENDTVSLAKLKELDDHFSAFVATGKTMAESYMKQDKDKGNKEMERFDAAAESLGQGLEPFAQAQTAQLDQSMQRIPTECDSLRLLSVILTIFTVVLSGVSSWLITRSITRPINRVINGLREGAEQVTEAAGQVSSASQQMAEGASEQASSLEETSSALEQMSAMTRTNAGNAKQADELSTQARTAADEGDHTMGRLNQAMTSINDSSEKISKIIKVIEEIAFQTNLLALNAAVEAARAGEHGKGFAVVADEVRNLAQRAAQAAKETTSLIEGAVNNAREGTQVATDVGKALGAIVGNIGKVSELINGISKASDEQAQGVDQINTAVSQIDKVTQQNASGAEESASAAEELSAQAETVQGMVGELIALVGASRQGVGVSMQRLQSRAKRSPGPQRQSPPAAACKRSANPKGSSAGASDGFLSLDGSELKEF